MSNRKNSSNKPDLIGYGKNIIQTPSKYRQMHLEPTPPKKRSQSAHP